jgi:hypothetical protein
MEMLVIGLVAIIAFAAVLIPLFRRRPGVHDESEFEGGSSSAGTGAGTVAPMAAGPATPAGPAPVAPPDAAAGDDGADIEAEVARYRAALRAGTVCRKCGQANPEGSVFCADCGARLPLADAREFE